MKKLFLCTLLILTLISPSLAMTNSPQGFRGIKWGMKPNQIEDLELAKQENNDSWYQRKTDRLTLGNEVTLQSIYYVFNKRYGFYQAVLTTEGYDNYQNLRVTLLSWFDGATYAKMYVLQWVDDNARVYSDYDGKTSTTIIASHPLLKKTRSKHPMMEPSPYKIKNTPEGFKNIKWGTLSEDVKGLKFFAEDEDAIGYTKEHDTFKIGNLEFQDVKYIFHKKYGFEHASISSPGKDKYELLKKELQRKFGIPKIVQENEQKSRVVWTDDNADIRLMYSDEDKETKCFFSSSDIMSKEYHDENKADMERLAQDF